MLIRGAGNNSDIIDYEPADGDIRKMILGSITEEFDSGNAAAVEADDGSGTSMHESDTWGGGQSGLRHAASAASTLRDSGHPGIGFERGGALNMPLQHTRTWAGGRRNG